MQSACVNRERVQAHLMLDMSQSYNEVMGYLWGKSRRSVSLASGETGLPDERIIDVRTLVHHYIHTGGQDHSLIVKTCPS